MPPQNSYDYTQDPMFLQAAPKDQHDYLMANDPDYAAAGAKDRMEYLSSIQQPTQFENQQNSKQAQQDAKLNTVQNMGRGALDTVGGMVGGAIGGGAGLLGGGPVGAGLGAGAGGALGAGGADQLSQWIMSMGGNGPSPTSKAGLIDSGVAAAGGFLGEAPGGVLRGFGNNAEAAIAAEAQARSNAATAQTRAGWAKLMSLPRPANEFGDVGAAITRNAPADVSKSGLRTAFLTDNVGLSRQLTGSLKGASGTADLDSLLLNTRNNAAIAETIKPGTAKMVDNAISTARAAAGITDPAKATVSQLADFRKALNAFNPADPTGTMQVVKPLLKDAYTQVNGTIRSLSPDSADILDKMQNNHAALKALQLYGKAPELADVAAAKVGVIGKAGMIANQHPAATAAISPALAGGMLAGKIGLRKAAQAATGQIWQ